MLCARSRRIAATRIGAHCVGHAVANADLFVRRHIKFMPVHENISLACVGPNEAIVFVGPEYDLATVSVAHLRHLQVCVVGWCKVIKFLG